MNRLYVPHIDKTGGQSIERIIQQGCDRSGWTWVHNSGKPYPDPPIKYARLGMHQAYDPKLMRDLYFKLLVIRNPIDRFVSAFNFFRFEVWRDTGKILDMTVDEFLDITIAKHKGDSVYPTYRGYISMLTSLNAEQQNNDLLDIWEWSLDNTLDEFDKVIDTTRINELKDILQVLDILVDTKLHVNNTSIHYETMGLTSDDLLTVEQLTDNQYRQLESMEEFQEDLKLWETYIANYK